MRQGKSGSKLGVTTSHKKAMLRNMVTSFLKYEKIKTTDTKAKELKKIAEKVITLGKCGSLHARRQVLSYVRDKKVVGKLFADLSTRYRDRNGGYTRTIKIGNRTGDNAPISVIELIQEGKKEEKRKRKAL